MDQMTMMVSTRTAHWTYDLLEPWTNRTIWLNDSINIFEYYMIPVCFVIGLVGNLTGSLCILNESRMRRQTPLFILAIIGLSDTILVVSQTQRWLGKFYESRVFLTTNVMCKFYFMMVRFSVLLSASLLFTLVMIRLISLYCGTYRLSIYSNVGQIFSRLSVIYILALCLSISWHELWSSGLKSGNMTITGEYTDYAETTEGYRVRLNDLRCTKNVIDSNIIHSLHLMYFLMLFGTYVLLVVLSAVVYIRMRNCKCLASIGCDDVARMNSSAAAADTDRLETVVQHRIDRHHLSSFGSKLSRAKQQSSFNSLPVFKEPTSSNDEYTTSANANEPSCAKLMKKKSMSIENLNEIVVVVPAPEHERRIRINENNNTNLFTTGSGFGQVSSGQKRRKFTSYVILVSFLTGLLAAPYALYDFVYFHDDETAEESSDSARRLALILLNIPHSFKFYLLFLFYARFRVQLSRFLKIRLYINFKYVKRKLFVRNNGHGHVNINVKHHQHVSVSQVSTPVAGNSLALNSSSNSINQNHPSAMADHAEPTANFRIRIIHRFNPLCLGKKTPKQSTSINNNTNGNNSRRRPHKANKFKNIDSFIELNMDSSYCDESSSVVGFKPSLLGGSAPKMNGLYDFYTTGETIEMIKINHTNTNTSSINSNHTSCESERVRTTSGTVRMSLTPREATVV